MSIDLKGVILFEIKDLNFGVNMQLFIGALEMGFSCLSIDALFHL